MDERLEDRLKIKGQYGTSDFYIDDEVLFIAAYPIYPGGRTFCLSLDEAARLRDWLNANLPFTLHLEGDEQPAPYSPQRLTPAEIAEQAKQWFATQDMETTNG